MKITILCVGKIKEKFYKANMTVRGSGIGLAVTNELIVLHGGELDIASEEGTGTLVTIFLPVEQAPSQEELRVQTLEYRAHHLHERYLHR